MKNLILGGVRMALGPDYDIATHFTPRYHLWDQRLCLVPDGDRFKAIREKHAAVVTNDIDTSTYNGIRLKNGSELATDIIVTATGVRKDAEAGLEAAVAALPELRFRRIDDGSILGPRTLPGEPADCLRRIATSSSVVRRDTI